jgi:hypothetical protein
MGKISCPLKPRTFVTVAADAAKRTETSAATTAATERHFAMRFIGRKLPAAGEIGEIIRR